MATTDDGHQHVHVVASGRTWKDAFVSLLLHEGHLVGDAVRESDELVVTAIDALYPVAKPKAEEAK